MEGGGLENLFCDGHDFASIVDAIEEAHKIRAPVVIFAKTLRGKGFPVIENTKYRGRVQMMQGSILSMRDTLGKLLVELGEKDPDIIVMTADVGDSTRASKFKERFSDRYFNVGISEQDLVNFAAGLSAVGKKPVVVNFAMFLMRAWEQIRNSIARMNLNVNW